MKEDEAVSAVSCPSLSTVRAPVIESAPLTLRCGAPLTLGCGLRIGETLEPDIECCCCR